MLEFPKRDPLMYAGFEQLILRGTAEVLEDGPRGCFLRDRLGGAYILAAETTELSLAWLEAHDPSRMRLLEVFDHALVRYLRDRYGADNLLRCRQARWYGPAPEATGDLDIAPAVPSDFGVIRPLYNKMTDAELMAVIHRSELFLGRTRGEICGFIGWHPEGSIGLLEVLPGYRRRGFGAALERFLIGETLRKGWIPFAQIETGNEASLRLQTSVGMHISRGSLYWVFRDIPNEKEGETVR